MANTASAKKEARKNEKRRLANKNNLTKTKTLHKAALAKSNKDEALAIFKDFEKAVSSLVNKKLLHINTAGRRISNLYSAIKQKFSV